MTEKPKTCSLLTLGCKVNQYESQYFREMLELNGIQIVEEDESTDLCIINTCTVTHDADAKGRNIIRKIQSRNPKSIILVTGCYAEREPETLRKIPGVAKVIGNKEEFLNSLSEFGIQQRPKHITRFDEHQRAFVKVQDGCLLNCSYCIIPSVRPNLRSRHPQDILDEIEQLEQNGYQEVVLNGIHLGHYGIDLSKGKPKAEWNRLWHLLGDISRRFPSMRIRLSSLEAAEARDDLIKVIRDHPRVAAHFHLCLQSGSDKILAAMRRRYTAQGFRERVHRIREALDTPGFSTDIIVGFPGETEEDFEQTCQISREAGFFKMHVFPYSPREGTPAANIRETVSHQEKSTRRQILEMIECENRGRFQANLQGKQEEVLVESASFKPGFVEGTSSRGIRISLPGMLDALRRKLVPVIVNGIEKETLLGQPIPVETVVETQHAKPSSRISLQIV